MVGYDRRSSYRVYIKSKKFFVTVRDVDFDKNIDTNWVPKTSIENIIKMDYVDSDYELDCKNDEGNSYETPISGTLNGLQPTENPDTNTDTTTPEDLDDDQLNATYYPLLRRSNHHTTGVPLYRLVYGSA